mmetsp:Transcript_113346/g.259929  ORF Transcript_113346/g.259929 Transcript_113346/m.259929 type:complete len:419 (+) Transcript_113346:1132-2388(+)
MQQAVEARHRRRGRTPDSSAPHKSPRVQPSHLLIKHVLLLPKALGLHHRKRAFHLLLPCLLLRSLFSSTGSGTLRDGCLQDNHPHLPDATVRETERHCAVQAQHLHHPILNELACVQSSPSHVLECCRCQDTGVHVMQMLVEHVLWSFLCMLFPWSPQKHDPAVSQEDVRSQSYLLAARCAPELAEHLDRKLPPLGGLPGPTQHAEATQRLGPEGEQLGICGCPHHGHGVTEEASAQADVRLILSHLADVQFNIYILRIGASNVRGADCGPIWFPLPSDVKVEQLRNFGQSPTDDSVISGRVLDIECTSSPILLRCLCFLRCSTHLGYVLALRSQLVQLARPQLLPLRPWPCHRRHCRSQVQCGGLKGAENPPETAEGLGFLSGLGEELKPLDCQHSVIAAAAGDSQSSICKMKGQFS